MRSWFGNWKKRRDANVEAELRAARPEPSARFVKTIAAHINPRAVRPVRTRTRIGVAAVATACMAAVVGATGGFSLAASSVLGATHSVTHIGAPHNTSAAAPVAHGTPVSNAECTQYGSVPTISSFTPTSGGAGNTTVTVSGTNFSGLSQVSSVSVGGSSASANVLTSTQLTFLVPSDAALGTSKISVTNCKGTATSTDNFTVLAAPSISTVTPGDGGVGTPVVIAGTGFTGTSSVTIGGVSASFTTNDAGTEIDTTVPLKAPVGPGSVQVFNPAGSDSFDFTVDSGAPTVTSFTPISGPAGTTVKVMGKGFFEGQSSAPDTSDISVQFGNGGSAEPTSIDKDTQLTVAVPADAATGPITVLTQLGGATSKASFTFFGTPQITGFSPGFGKVASKVTITGSSFTGATAVDFGSTSDPTAAATGSKIAVKDGTITATVPVGAVTGPITVVTPRGNATSGDTFTVIAAPPNPTNVDPAHAGYNANVTITGDTLTGVTAVAFNGKKQPAFTIVSDTEIDTTVPVGTTLGAGTGKTAGIVLTNASGSTSIAFTVDNTAPTIAKVTSDAAGKKVVTSGKPGDTVYLNGTHLDGVDSVDIGDSTVTVFANQTATQIQLTIPTGDSTTAAKISANNSTTDTFGLSAAAFTVYESPVVIGVPAYGAGGKALTVTGANFQSAKTVTFTPDGGGTTVTANATPSADGTSLKVTPTNGKVVVGHSYSLTVTLADGLSGNSGGAEIQIVGLPKVTALVQTGDSIEVDGSNFTGATSVTIGTGKTATAISSYTVATDGKITFTLAGTEPSGVVYVTNAAGTGSDAKAPLVGGPTLKTATLTVATQAVKLGGTGLLGSNGSVSVTINDTPASFTPGRTQTQASVTVIGSGLTKGETVTIVVTTDVGSTSKSVKF